MATQALKKLDARHHAAIRLKIEGRSVDEIATELNVQKRTLHIWFSDPLVKEEYAKRQDEINEVFAEKMASAGINAIETLTAFLNEPTDDGISTSQKIYVAEGLMDRIGATARVRDKAAIAQAAGAAAGAGQGDITNYTAVFANMDNRSIADFIKGWQEGGSDSNGRHPTQPVIDA